MTRVETVLVSRDDFARVQVSEAVLEGLLRTHGNRIFPGYSYFDFKPPIPSRYGTRHPDGVLVAAGHRDWWVVEVETHLHDVEGHVMPQLEALAEGAYGREAFRYLERHVAFDKATHEMVDVWEPSFLLIVDHVTPFIRDAAAINGFAVTEVSVYRSESAEYALRVAGDRPSVAVDRAERGLDVEVRDGGGIALLVPVSSRLLEGPSRRTLLVGDAEIPAYVTGSRDMLALSVTVDDLYAAIGQTPTYRITTKGELIPLVSD